MNTRELLEWDAEHLIHGIAPVGEKSRAVIDRAEGMVFYDTEGREYLEAGSQLTCVNLGYAYNDEIAAVAAAQLRKLPYSALFFGITNSATIECGQRLAALTPEGLAHFCFTSGGSESVESAFKFARLYWSNRGSKKYKIISSYDSYHGMSFGAMSATGGGKGLFHKGQAPLAPGFIHVPSYYCYRCALGLEYPKCKVQCARLLERAIEKEDAETVAAVIMEPEIGTAGMVPPPPEYWPMLRDICTRHNVLLIADEVMTGFGRTGKAFAVEHWGVVPDMITMANGISSACVPFGAVAVNDEIFAGLKGSRLSTFTYSGHPVAAAVASKVMEIYVRDGIFENAAAMGKYATERLQNQFLPLPNVGEVSGLGLMIGMELVKDKATREAFPPGSLFGIHDEAFARGVFIRVADAVCMPGSRIEFCPPLVIDRKGIDKALDILYPIVAGLSV